MVFLPFPAGTAQLAKSLALALAVWSAPAPAPGQDNESGPLDTPTNAAQTPAVTYAGYGGAACLSELVRRGIGFTKVSEARGVLAPVRLTAALHGVSYHSGLAPKQRATSPYEILDCRLVLALDDFSAILAKHDVVEVVHMSAYRPPPQRKWAAGQIGQRHDGGLAIDAGSFVRRDGTTFDVERDFHGRIGSRTCGPNTGPSPATPAALALRAIVCEAADGHLFNVALTPDYNWQHRNHLHLEITARVKWFLVH